MAASDSAEAPAWERPATFVEGFHNEAAVRKMPLRPLGRTGRRVSVLALGASALGGVYGDDTSGAEAEAVVVDSIRAGVNVVDTAPWYGHGRSEEVLGRALSGVPRSAYYLHTKVGRYESAVDKMFDFRAERVERSVEQSLARLRVEHLDLVQVHDPEFAPSLRVVLEQTLPALQRLVDRGKVRGVGITGYPLGVLRELAERSTVPLDTCLSYCRLNLEDTSLADSGAAAELSGGRGLGLISASPLAMGLLTAAGPPSWHPAGAAAKAAAAAAAAYAAERGSDISRLAMVFALRRPEPATVMVSTASRAYAADNVAYATGEKSLTDDEESLMAEIRERFFEPLQRRGEQHWEGLEVDAYWTRLGKRLCAQSLYPELLRDDDK